jgi:hypothetical protein
MAAHLTIPHALKSLTELHQELDGLRIEIEMLHIHLGSTLRQRYITDHKFTLLCTRMFHAGYDKETGLTRLGDQETQPIISILSRIDRYAKQIKLIDRLRRFTGQIYESLKSMERELLEAIKTAENIIEAQELAAYETGGIFSP